MAIPVANVKEPLGELDMALLFPGVSDADNTARLQSYLDRAYTDMSAAGVDASRQDRGAEVYAYARAYASVFQRLSANPIRKDIAEQGSLGYDKQQHNVFDSLARKYQAEYNSIIESGLAPLELPDVVGRTDTVPTQVTW